MVCCARCGNRRTSNNPEWLARVKRRCPKHSPDIIPECSGPTEAEYGQGRHRDPRHYHAYKHSPPPTGGPPPVNGQTLDPKELQPLSSDILSQRHVLGAFTYMRDSSQNMATLSTASASNGSLMSSSQPRTKSSPLESRRGHRYRQSGHQFAVSTIPMSQSPVFYSSDATATNPLLQSDISVARSTRGASASLPLGMQRNTTRPCTEQSGTISAYELSERTSTMNDETLLTSRGISLTLAARHDTVDATGPLTATPTPPSCNLGVNVAVAVQSEESAEGGRDLGVDFANENFGFDIDSILDEPAPPHSTVASQCSYKHVSDPRDIHPAAPRTGHCYFHD